MEESDSANGSRARVVRDARRLIASTASIKRTTSCRRATFVLPPNNPPSTVTVHAFIRPVRRPLIYPDCFSAPERGLFLVDVCKSRTDVGPPAIHPGCERDVYHTPRVDRCISGSREP